MARLVPIQEPEQRRPRLVPIEEPDVGTPVAATGRAALERLADNVLGIPSFVATGLLNIESPLSMLRSETSRQIQEARTGEPVERRTLFQDLTGREPPAMGERIFGLPSGEQAVAGLDAASQVPGALLSGQPLNLSQRFERSLSQGQALGAEHPAASTIGNVAGDVATLATGRAPFARGIGRAESRLMRPRALPDLDVGVRRIANRALASAPVRKVLRGAGRSAETGVEATALAMLQGGDPLEAAGVAAGGQAATSGALQLTKEMFSGAGRLPLGAKLAAGAVGSWAIIQTLKALTPGGQDRVLESAESAFDKLAAGLVVGAVSAAAGGRLRGGRFGEDLPRLADALSTIPRAAVLSTLQQWREAEQLGEGGDIEATLERLAADGFSGETRERLLRAFKNGRLGETVNSLVEDDSEFRAQLRAPLPSPQERAQRRLRDEVSADTEGVRLPGARDVAERLGAGENVESGAAFVHGQLRDPRRAGEVLRRLGRKNRLDALEITLTRLLRQSERREGARNVIDGERLQRQWDSLPSSTREAFPQPTRRAIESFIGEAAATPQYALPPMLARSLMTTNGRLSRRLRGEND